MRQVGSACDFDSATACIVSSDDELQAPDDLDRLVVFQNRVNRQFVGSHVKTVPRHEVRKASTEASPALEVVSHVLAAGANAVRESRGKAAIAACIDPIRPVA